MIGFLSRKYLRFTRFLRYRSLGLECSSYDWTANSLPSEVWTSQPSNHFQVVSPGRSGTRWLSSLLIDLTNAFVCHASTPTLAEPGYLFDRGFISDDEMLGSYRSSRCHFLSLAELTKRHYIDLDCKNSPAASVIANHYVNCKFLIMIRDPFSFVTSGIFRGYFLDHNPRSWGHLESIDLGLYSTPEELQIYKIAAFWRRIALISDNLILSHPHRTYVLNVSKMFSHSPIVQDLFSWLELPLLDPTLSSKFYKRININSRSWKLSPLQTSILSSSTFRDFCLTGITDHLLQSSGIIV